MCGIAGMIDWRRASSASALRTIGLSMNEALRHRGPDGEGIWVDAETGIVLAHRRLAVIDLSPGGFQPMHSHDGRYVITFNGEIYNFGYMRDELAAAGRLMRTNLDTEVLLEACALWGIEKAVERTIGMFAFALWDCHSRTLHLARDRLGVKPLYYEVTSERVLFASQLKAFRALPTWKPTIDEDSVVAFLRCAYIPNRAPFIARQPNLCQATYSRCKRDARVRCFWNARAIAASSTARNEARRE